MPTDSGISFKLRRELIKCSKVDPGLAPDRRAGTPGFVAPLRGDVIYGPEKGCGEIIPQFDVDIMIGSIDVGMLRVVWLDEVSYDGIGDNRRYEDLSEVEWDEIADVIAEEESLLHSAAAQAADGDEFDQILDRELEERYPGDEFDEGPLSSFASLDVGVMSAVAALSASGCVTTTSCRGHRLSGEPNPLVRFTTDEARLPLIQMAAERTGCGLLLDQDGMLQLYTKNVFAFVNFARDLLTRQEEFDAIETCVVMQRPADSDSDFYAEVRRMDLSPTGGVPAPTSSTCDEAQPTLFDSDQPSDQ